MADKGIGIGHCEKHGDYFKDAEDSPCPACEDAQEVVERDTISGKTRAELYRDAGLGE